MLACDTHPDFAAIMVKHGAIMVHDKTKLRIDIRVINGLSGPKPVHHLAKQPWLTISASANHDTICAALHQSSLRVFNIADVAIYDDRQ